MLRQLLVGSAVSACNIVIHALIMVAVVLVARMVGTKHTLHPWLFLIAVMVATVSVLMIAHARGTCLGACLRDCERRAFRRRSRIFRVRKLHHARLRRHNAGESWRLLGPITAMNGMLLFGWSTAVIFEVLRRALMKVDMLS